MSQSIEAGILQALATQESVSSEALAEELQVAHQDLVGAAKSLESDGYIVSEMCTKSVWKLTAEARHISDTGSPEYVLWSMLNEGEMSQAAAAERLGKARFDVALSNGMKTKIFKLAKRDGAMYLSRNPVAGDAVEDKTRLLITRALRGGHVDPTEAETIKKRQLGTLETVKLFTYRKGAHYAPTRRAKAAGDLTREMLQDGSWRTTEFKAYNLNAAGAEVDGGQLHPLLKVRQEFREILMELGFQEMDTQHWVESSFWNFDTLFIPQQHPARDVQDTFFLSKPRTTTLQHDALLEKIRNVHETAFRGAWKEEEAMRNVLRTHTTGTSAFTLYKLAQMSPRDGNGRLLFRPGRYYSIDRVFRNEEMDRTHLCEFHQVEGFVIDRDISLAKMMHTFNAFFRRIGVTQLRFKPTYNPYTEPSMEVFGFHTGLKKWIEVGNSGLFRPEMLGPLGFEDEDVAVMAWGLSLERPTMIKYGLNSIHELFGHRVDINFIKRSVIARF